MNAILATEMNPMLAGIVIFLVVFFIPWGLHYLLKVSAYVLVWIIPSLAALIYMFIAFDGYGEKVPQPEARSIALSMTSTFCVLIGLITSFSCRLYADLFKLNSNLTKLGKPPKTPVYRSSDQPLPAKPPETPVSKPSS